MPDIFDEDENLFGPQSTPEPDPPDWFDEEAYLRANPDVAESVALGSFKSAYQHFCLHGRKEQRPLHTAPSEPRNQLIRTEQATGKPPVNFELRAALDAVLLSPSGGVLLVGWVDDMVAPLEWVRLSGPGWHLTLGDSRTARVRRTDVEAALSSTRIHPFGFFSFDYTAESFDVGGGCQVLMHLSNGREVSFDVQARRVSEIELRDTVLNYVVRAEMFGNRQVESVRMLRGPLSAAIVKHNRSITNEIVRGAYVERFGQRSGKPRGSMVVCLYGKPEYLFLQSALFSGGPGFEDYEMVFVSNSPELAEQLMKDVRTCALVYGLPQTVVLLPGNAGFGAANNMAVNHTRSNRVLIVNPDVFPRDQDWARKHTQIVSRLPKEQTNIFGAPLYYDDGSLMHGGMYFEYDTGLSMDSAGMSALRLVRVEHYGKGSPDWSDRFTRPRPVPAVTGAFMSAARPWFEKLGGFTEDFVFGHYEDADLCLKSISAGIAPWIHDIKLWHLEGKGSARLPVHEGGSYLNRAIFSERWERLIGSGLEGPNPSHPLLSGSASSREPTSSDSPPRQSVTLQTPPVERATPALSRNQPLARSTKQSLKRRGR